MGKTELRTKAKGRKAGAIGQGGPSSAWRCLLHQFHNTSTGQCDPGYTAIQARTGMCRAAVAEAIKRLEATGIICVMRRLVRNGWRVVQTTNAYLFPASTPVHPPMFWITGSHLPDKILYPYKVTAPADRFAIEPSPRRACRADRSKGKHAMNK